ERRDEIGDVARGFDGMLDRLEETMGRLRESEARLAGAQRLARLGSFSLGPGPDELHASAELRRILGLAEDAPLDAERLQARIHAEDRPRLAAAIEGCRRDGTPFELDVRAGDAGGERILHAQGERLARADGAVQVEGTLQDVTDRKLVEGQVRYLAYHDSLTSLGNRRLFQERLARPPDTSRPTRGALARAGGAGRALARPRRLPARERPARPLGRRPPAEGRRRPAGPGRARVGGRPRRGLARRRAARRRRVRGAPRPDPRARGRGP